MTTLSPSHGIYWLVYRKEVGSWQFEEKWGTQREYLWTPEKHWNFSKLRWGGVNPIYCVCVLESKRRSVNCQLWWSLRSATSCTFVMVPSCNAGRPAAKIGQANGLQALFLPRPSNLLVPDGPHLFLLKYSLWKSLSFPTSHSLSLTPVHVETVMGHVMWYHRDGHMWLLAGRACLSFPALSEQEPWH
jgi:hypothetical protein